MGRDDYIKVRLTEDMKVAFQTIANEYGMTMSALGSYIVGSYVKQQRRIIDPLLDSLGEKIIDSVKEQMIVGKE